ncbi:uncharacterized protein LOC142228058 [Haematobia irritans]|uniref:uncharacterized protein LOC142228058 n=1 Tax=Haematobia irritans TaxID=7368 RepID=UPI003F4FDCED
MSPEEKTLTADTTLTVVYKDTTLPKKPKRKDKSDLGPDFIAPDGGWGWVVCIACGLSNLCLFPPLQQYGLIYKERMANSGFDAKEITTIINTEMALSCLVGLVNGAMFRRFSFRQVAIVGSLLAFTGMLLSAFCESFVQYLICFSMTYGIGLGLCMAANSLAVNTYFKIKRRKATGFTWTLTGLGAVIFPQVSNLLLTLYGPQGTIMIYAAVGLNALLCALTLQPAMWHSPKPELIDTSTNITLNDSYECEYCQYQKKDKRSAFSTEYDDPDRPGYEITEPGTPMIARANDGWFGSKLSLTTDVGSRYRSNRYLRQLSKQESYESAYKPNYFNREKEETDRYISKASVYPKGGGGGSEALYCTCAEEKALLQIKSEEIKKQEAATLKALLEADELAKRRMTFWQKIVFFFDLGLLKDLTFVNLAVGMTIMMFGEINFSILVPFILSSFGYSVSQISMAMSLLAGVDIAVRLLAPLFLEKVKLGNQALFAIGIIMVTIGRLGVTLTDSYAMLLGVFVLIGLGKGLRTIFAVLIIPSYVPLKRLPAASGLQLICTSIVSFTLGPLLGIITDSYGYKVTIHCINVITCITLMLWLIEYLCRKKLSKPAIDANS